MVPRSQLHRPGQELAASVRYRRKVWQKKQEAVARALNMPCRFAAARLRALRA